MFKLHHYAAVALFAFALGGAAPARAQERAPAFLGQSASAALLTQFQGVVAKPELPCGLWIHVEGVPGSAYSVYVNEPGEAPLLVDAGVFPRSGSITKAYHVVGCTQPGPWSRARVISESEAPMIANVGFY